MHFYTGEYKRAAGLGNRAARLPSPRRGNFSRALLSAWCSHPGAPCRADQKGPSSLPTAPPGGPGTHCRSRGWAASRLHRLSRTPQAQQLRAMVLGAPAHSRSLRGQEEPFVPSKAQPKLPPPPRSRARLPGASGRRLRRVPAPGPPPPGPGARSAPAPALCLRSPPAPDSVHRGRGPGCSPGRRGGGAGPVLPTRPLQVRCRLQQPLLTFLILPQPPRAPLSPESPCLSSSSACRARTDAQVKVPTGPINLEHPLHGPVPSTGPLSSQLLHWALPKNRFSTPKSYSSPALSSSIPRPSLSISIPVSQPQLQALETGGGALSTLLWTRTVRTNRGRADPRQQQRFEATE